MSQLSLSQRLTLEAEQHRRAMSETRGLSADPHEMSNCLSMPPPLTRACPITGSEDENLREYHVHASALGLSSQSAFAETAIDVDDSQSQALEDDLHEFLDSRVEFTGDESCTDTQGEQPPNTPVTNPLADEDPIETLMSQEDVVLDPDFKEYQKNALMDMVAD